MSGIARGLLASAAALLLAGCGDARTDFIGERTHEVCDAAWPSCGGVAGCLLDGAHYTEGRFPGQGRFLVRVAEPSTLRLGLYLHEVRSAGEALHLTVYEEACRARDRQGVPGSEAVEAVVREGQLVRESEVTGVGDHLVELESDMQARYVLKLEVLPARSR